DRAGMVDQRRGYAKGRGRGRDGKPARVGADHRDVRCERFSHRAASHAARGVDLQQTSAQTLLGSALLNVPEGSVPSHIFHISIPGKKARGTTGRKAASRPIRGALTRRVSLT